MTSHLLRGALLWLACILFQSCTDATAPGIASVTAVISTAALDPTDRDPDGYLLAIDGGPARAVEVDASVEIDSLPPGTHLLALTGMAANCKVFGANPRPVKTPAQQPIIVSFSISCAPRTGTVHVSVTTGGVDVDTDGYAVTVAGIPPATILPNGGLDLPGVREGAVQVRLSGIVDNCAVAGANPQTVSVKLGATTDALFNIQCSQAGGIQVTTMTSGTYLNQDSYRFEIKRPGDSSGVRIPISPSGTAAVPGVLGDYTMTLLDVGANCDVAGPNPRALTVTGGATTAVAFDITCGPPAELAIVLVSPNNDDIYAISTDGSGEHSLTNDPKLDLDPAWSPDGARVAFASERDGNREIYVMNADGTRPLRLTNVPAADQEPAWSPDGTRIAFVSDRDGRTEIYVMNADGSNQVRLTSGPNYYGYPAWSPDGGKIAFASSGGGTEGIWIMNADGSGAARLTTTTIGDVAPAWSPDGTRIAFSRIRADNSDIFLVNVDGSGLSQLTHWIDNAADPAWSPDGRKIALGAVSKACGYYDYYNECPPYVVIVSTSGVPYAETTVNAFDPAWRP